MYMVTGKTTQRLAMMLFGWKTNVAKAQNPVLLAVSKTGFSSIGDFQFTQ